MTSGKLQDTKSVAILYTNNKSSEREIKTMIPFIVTSKRVKYLEIHLTKDINDVYTENDKIFVREIKEDTKEWKGIPYCGLE